MTSEVAFADANLFIRVFTRDDPAQTEAVLTLFRRAAAGELTLLTNHLVIAELVWAMESAYRLDAKRIRLHIMAILNTPGIKVESADLITQAIDLYLTERIDFADAYHIFWLQAQGIKLPTPLTANTFPAYQQLK